MPGVGGGEMSEEQAATTLPEQTETNSRGTPSDGLARLKAAQQKAQAGAGGVLETADQSSYEPLTESNPEAGTYRLVGGYLDENGELHKEVEIEAMSGHEEDMLGNRKIPVVLRLNGVLSRVVKRLGTITDRGTISRAVNDMPLGSRQHLLVCMRITSHWMTEKDVYKFLAKCPRQTCQEEDNYQVDLLSLEHYEPEDPSRQHYEVQLPYSGDKVSWRVLPGEWDHALDLMRRKEPNEYLTHAIMSRLLSVNGKHVSLSISDVLSNDLKKVKTNRRSIEVKKMSKDWKTGDRDFLRASFLEHEPGIDTDIQCECDSCGNKFTIPLDVAQESFFFPQATSMRSKTRSFI